MSETTGIIPGIESRMRAARASFSECSIEKYTYTSLSDPSTEIRLLDILPGAKEDPIIVQIDHARLADCGSPTKLDLSQKSVDNINESLPTGWVAFVTWSDRVIYFNKELGASTWQNPAARDSTSSPDKMVIPNPDRSAHIPHYEALSYAWGFTESRNVIYVQCPDGDHRKILVTENLALALRDLRFTAARRRLWIDAICINQEDIKERSAQVQIMTSIYRLAHKVVVWLGPASDSSSLAMSTLEYLGEQVEISREGHVIPTPQAFEKDWYRNDAVIPYKTKTWDAVMELCQRPYFTRVWIIQELHLSNHCTIVQCGSDSVTWVNLRKAIKCFPTKRSFPYTGDRDATAVVRQLADYDPRGPYSKLTRAVQSRSCSNDRDRVYGLLGLMPEGLRDRITPNYEMTVGEVYRQETVAQIEFFQRLHVLCECGPHRAIDGPSWVPNLASRQLSIFPVRSAAGISRCYVAFDNPNVAEVSGLQAGTVVSVQEKGHWEFGKGIEHSKSWAYQALDRDVYCLTLCGMFVRERWHEDPNMIHYLDPLVSLEEWKRFYFGDVGGTGNSGQSIAPVFLKHVERCIWARTLFTMGDGRIGLGPEAMKNGDSVCVFLGCDSPIILRQQSDGTYQVVGEAFVYALLDAQALLGPLPEPWFPVQKSSMGRPLYWFLNRETGEMTQNDPRLGPLIGWERLDVEMGADDPRTCQKYRNIETGQVINFDPRMSLDTLKARGVKLRTFALS
ncbi:hypothetical protein KVR01_006274 [Diaporthe batatas]|uniref:uncharacterized protein n=1 Tax=Diaporthe batatas TaxID=748121 RepID=UPI001D051A83|nr:uncharacterized protein KVR01_006274 [Diaporthe batatas]KAG8164356.1 hypothetical protein KVR01_006274 [Diaporthe batatas]